MKIIGVDLGHANVQTSEGITFESKTKLGITNMNEDDIKVIHNKIGYTIGSYDGALNIRKNKHKKTAYKVSLLTGIAKSFKDDNINCNVVVGVPVEQFNDKEFVKDVKDTIESWGKEEIILNDVTKKINIENVEVFTESGIVFSNTEKYQNEKTLVIDFGGSTVDVSFWDGLTLIKARTYKEGMITLYENIIRIVNGEFGTKLSSVEASNMIGKEKFEINQKTMDITFIQPIIETYIDGLTSYINQYFPVESATLIELMGGGAISLGSLLKEEYEKANIVEKPDFANANTYKKVGKMLWM